jgi:hypothetical protein
MKKLNWHFLLVFIVAIGIAFGMRPKPKAITMHTYSFAFWSTDHTRMYYGMDLTAQGYQKGIDYDCIAPAWVCTFIAEVTEEQSDYTGTFFYTVDVPQSGIDDTGSWLDLD